MAQGFIDFDTGRGSLLGVRSLACGKPSSRLLQFGLSISWNKHNRATPLHPRPRSGQRFHAPDGSGYDFALAARQKNADAL